MSTSLNEHLCDSAQQQLAALRAAVDDRLTALEEVLADPSRGESLEGLILDLSRIAAEEAQAAASRACIDVKTDADRQAAVARAALQESLERTQEALGAAEAALERERAATAEIQRTLEQAQQQAGLHAHEVEQRVAAAEAEGARRAAEAKREAQEQIAALTRERDAQANLVAAERQRQEELSAVREQLEGEIVRLRATAAELERAATDARQAVEHERAAAAESGTAAERAQQQLASLERDNADLRAAHAAANDALGRAQQSAAALDRDRLEADARLQAERTANARTQSQLEAARAALEAQLEAERSVSAGLRQAAEHAAHQARATANASAEGSALKAALADAQSQLEAHRKTVEELQQALEQAERRMASVAGENVQHVADHDRLTAQLSAATAENLALRAELEALRAPAETRNRHDHQKRPALTDPTPAGGHHDAARTKHAAGAKHVPAVSVEDGWQAIRLNPRYVFAESITIQVNGDPGKLVDLSISGCQLLAPIALKPNQVVKVLLPYEKSSIACTGRVVWARLEPATKGRPLSYRAGLTFTKRDEAAIETFVIRHGHTP